MAPIDLASWHGTGNLKLTPWDVPRGHVLVLPASKPKPGKGDPLAGALPGEHADQVKFLDLAAIPVRTRNISDPQFTVHMVRCPFHSPRRQSAMRPGFETWNLPPRLRSPFALPRSRAVPSTAFRPMQKSDSQAKQIRIPADTRMVIGGGGVRARGVILRFLICLWHAPLGTFHSPFPPEVPGVHWKPSSRHFRNLSRSSRTHPTCF